MSNSLVIILQSQMSDQGFALKVAQGVLQLHGLDEQVVLRIQPGRGHRRLEVEAEPFMYAEASQPCSARRKRPRAQPTKPSRPRETEGPADPRSIRRPRIGP